jgi:hypothetical protein
MLRQHPITIGQRNTNPQNPEFHPSIREKAIKIAFLSARCNNSCDLGDAVPGRRTRGDIANVRCSPNRIICNWSAGSKGQPLMIGEMGGQP